jgi:hypothetical protein
MPVSVQPPVKAFCPDCGHTPVNHFVEKMNATIEEMSRPFFTFQSFQNGLQKVAPTFFKCLATARLGTIVHEPDTLTTGRARCIWLEAKRRGIDIWEFRPFGISREMFVAEIVVGVPKKPRIIVFDGLPRPALTLSGKKGLPASLAWVDNKSLLKKKLAAAGVPVARGGMTFTWKKTKEIFGQLQCSRKLDRTASLVSYTSVIIKPSTGSRSRHTTTGITDITELRRAFIKAKRLSPWVIVEEELEGGVYRGTVIDGKVVGIRRKDPPQVTGNGMHSLHELIDIENRRPERHGPVYRKIKTEDNDKKINLASDLDTIPKKGQIIILSHKTSIGSGGGSTDVTDIAHRDIIALLEKIAIILDDQVVGADFIVNDITRPLSDQPRSGIIECNSLPFIDVHLFPLNGKPRDTAAALWNVVIDQYINTIKIQ